MSDEERTFLRIVETGSVTAAAKDLGTDVSTASRRLDSLERRLGVKLLIRGPRKTEPTRAALRFYEGLRRLIDERDALEADLREEAETPRGLLRIAAPTNLGERHLTLWAYEFQQAYSRVSVDLVLDDRTTDLRAGSIDVAIRIGQLPDSSLTARRLGAMRLALVCAPQYLASRGKPLKPNELDEHDFVLFSLLQTGDRMKLTNAAGEAASITMRARSGVNNVGAIEHLILAGAGLHAGPLWLFQKHIDSGDLVHVLPDWSPPLYPVHAVHDYGRRPPAKVTRFIDMAMKRMAGLPGIEP